MRKSVLPILSLVILATATASGQTFADTDLTNADVMLERVYNTIFARAGIFVDIACFIGAVGAMIMISTHIYGRMLRGKSIYLSEVTRPIVIMAALILYTPMMQTINVVLKPTLTATKALVNGERDVLDNVLDQMLENDMNSGQFDAYVGPGIDGSFQKYIEVYGLEDESGWFGTDRIGQFISWRIETLLYKVRWAVL